MLQALPVLFFMMASVINLNYWINFYLSAVRTISQFDLRPFDNKLYNKRKFFLNYITGSVLTILIVYILLLGAYFDEQVTVREFYLKPIGSILEVSIGLAFGVTGYYQMKMF